MQTQTAERPLGLLADLHGIEFEIPEVMPERAVAAVNPARTELPLYEVPGGEKRAAFTGAVNLEIIDKDLTESQIARREKRALRLERLFNAMVTAREVVKKSVNRSVRVGSLALVRPVDIQTYSRALFS